MTNWYKIAQKKKCEGWLAVRLNKTVSKKIQAWGNKYIPEEDLAKNGRETDTHITLIYGMCNDDPSVVKASLKDFKPLKAKLKRIGYFENEKNDVVLIKIESKDLAELNKHLAETFNIKSTYSSYIPHSTIAYVKKGKAHRYAGDTSFDGIELTFDKIIFINNQDQEVEIKL